MTPHAWLLLVVYLVVLLILAKPLGTYIAHVMEGNASISLPFGTHASASRLVSNVLDWLGKSLRRMVDWN